MDRKLETYNRSEVYDDSDFIINNKTGEVEKAGSVIRNVIDNVLFSKKGFGTTLIMDLTYCR